MIGLMAGKWTDERRKAASDRAKARWANDPKLREKVLAARQSEEWRTKVSKPRRPGTGEKISKALTGRKLSAEHRESIGKSKMGISMHPNTAKALKKANTGHKHSEESKRLMSERKSELYWADPERQARRKTAMQKLTQDPAYQEKMRQVTKRAYAEGRRSTATFSELELLIAPILETVGYRHTGDGGFFVTGSDVTRCPDFKRRGKKQVLELFGDYWHLGDDPEVTVAWYKEAGYDCVVVWESDLPAFLRQYDPEVNPAWSRKQLRHYLRGLLSS